MVEDRVASGEPSHRARWVPTLDRELVAHPGVFERAVGREPVGTNRRVRALDGPAHEGPEVVLEGVAAKHAEAIAGRYDTRDRLLTCKTQQSG